MKNHNVLWILICLGIAISANCNAQVKGKKFSNVNEIPRNQYFLSDYMPADYKICYGNWKAVSTSGGFNGSGFTLDFDHLVLKPNGIFGILQNDSLLAYGKMALEKKGEVLNCKFIFDGKVKIELANDYEKFFQLTHPDTLILVAPCCDRYNIKLAREK
ncbi:MAG: hypothetical protein ACM3ME_02360 [Chloroflexota bacterium]